ncbi:hypothetical protein GCM10025777_10620 [Membranihabitans marinus]
MDIEVRQIKLDYHENIEPDWALEEIAELLAVQKWAQALPNLRNNEILVTADTIVIHNDQVLTKPKDAEEAHQFLLAMSDQSHVVMTGIKIGNREFASSFTDTTKVTFSPLSEKDIQYYIQHYSPFDKAGGYGIQEWIGWTYIHSIEGSFSNVMGLPTQKIHQWLSQYAE